MAHAPHPNFAQLHAHFAPECAELFGSGVATRTILALYPVTLETYASVLEAHYCAEREVPFRKFEVYNTVQSTPINTLEFRLRNFGPKDPAWVQYNAFKSVLLPKSADALSMKLIAAENMLTSDFRSALERQFTILTRSMRLLSDWDEAEFQNLPALARDSFAATMQRLIDFFEIEGIEFLT